MGTNLLLQIRPLLCNCNSHIWPIQIKTQNTGLDRYWYRRFLDYFWVHDFRRKYIRNRITRLYIWPTWIFVILMLREAHYLSIYWLMRTEISIIYTGCKALQVRLHWISTSGYLRQWRLKTRQDVHRNIGKRPDVNWLEAPNKITEEHVAPACDHFECRS